MPSVVRPKIKWVRVESGIRKRTNRDKTSAYEACVRRKGMPGVTLIRPTL